MISPGSTLTLYLSRRIDSVTYEVSIDGVPTNCILDTETSLICFTDGLSIGNGDVIINLTADGINYGTSTIMVIGSIF